MLNPLPELLLLSFFAPFILRVALGLAFLWFGYDKLFRRREPLILALRPFVVWGFGLVEMLAGLFLVVGYLTQIAALVVIIVALKALYFKKTYRAFAPHDTTTYLLVIAIAFSLLLSGAGAFAFDLPL